MTHILQLQGVGHFSAFLVSNINLNVDFSDLGKSEEAIFRSISSTEHASFSRTYYNNDIQEGLGERPRGLYLFLGGK